MDEAVSGEHAELRVRRAPRRKRGGPLAHALERENAMTAHNRAAIDDARDDWRKLAARHRHHRLIQHGEALLHASQGKQRAALQVAGECDEIALGKALADDACAWGFSGSDRSA
jgi:hypothetical protein